MEEFFSVPPDKPRKILIITTEKKHGQLRMIKAILNKTWEELLVDFVIQLFDEVQRSGAEGMTKAYREEIEKAMKSREETKSKSSSSI